MKARYRISLLGIIFLLLTGCGANKEVQPEVRVDSENESLKEDIVENTEQSDEDTEKIPLSKKELQQWSRYVNHRENNGFLLSFYDTPEEIDLNELFYSGCGMNLEALSKEEEKAYLELTGADEIYTECIKLTSAQIESVLQNRLGHSMEEMKKPLEWCYLKESDCYVVQNGDTNANRFTCTSGYREGKRVVLNCVAEYGNHTSDCRVTLQQEDAGDVWQFISNENIQNHEDAKAIWQIEEQSFDVELNDWGKVTFVSYEPEASVGVYYPPDVSFELFREGESVYYFPEISGEDFWQMGGIFLEIRAVAFQDVNEDGYQDVVVIVRYQEEVSEEENETEGDIPTFDLVRIYGGNKSSFYYMEELSTFINAEGKNQTIKDAVSCAAAWRQADAVPEEVYEKAVVEIGESNALQIRIMAEHNNVWKIKDYMPVAGNYAVYDLDGDGRLELLTNVVQGTGLFSDNHFYQVNEENTAVLELEQSTGIEEGIAFEIGVWGYEKQGKAYIDESGRILYAAADYGRAGAWFSGCSEGYYYLKNGVIESKEIRGYTIDFSENEDGQYTYYAPDSEEPISKEEWERLYQNFADGKKETDIHIEWKSLYEEEGEDMDSEEWFLLLTDSYRNASRIG